MQSATRDAQPRVEVTQQAVLAVTGILAQLLSRNNGGAPAGFGIACASDKECAQYSLLYSTGEIQFAAPDRASFGFAIHSLALY